MTTEEITIPQTEFVEVPVGIHNAVILDIEPADAYAGDPEAKPQLKFIFQLPDLADEDGTHPLKWAWANQSFNPRSKLWDWYQKVTGKTPLPAEPFRTSSMIGLSCRVFVNKVKQNTAAGPKEVVKIVDVLPAVNAPAAAPQTKGPSLAERLKTETAPDLICCVPKCKTPADDLAFDEDGIAFCATHRQ